MKVELYDSQHQQATRAFSLQTKQGCDRKCSRVPEGLFIEKQTKLVKFTLMSKVLKFLFGF